MNSAVQKNKSPAMFPALSLNGFAGIAPGAGIANKNSNYSLPIHKRVSPILYFRIKNEGLFPLEKIPSNAHRI
ncbi:MAG: hypothetical protein KJ737_16570 [Proteobacteria bacterium]|nr:hypothetical protein [Pseudomonadota bacterium]